jgi:hypothetical protein
MDNSLDYSKEKKVKIHNNIVQETRVMRRCISTVSFSSQPSSNVLIDFSRDASFEQGFSKTRNEQLIGFNEPM